MSTLFIVFTMRAAGVDTTENILLKKYTLERSPFRIHYDDSGEKLWDAFMLMKKANAGEQVAQHELGLRYLVGKDFPADTVKAVYWIEKAADQNLITAQYNYGLLLNDGCGTPWNPFDAYRRIKYAATRGLMEAEYVYGLLLTSNLVVQRNYAEAYRWILQAADSGYVPAKEVLAEFERRGITARINSQGKETQSDRSNIPSFPTSSAHPVFIDFTNDSIQEPDNETLMKEAVLERENQRKNYPDSMNIIKPDSAIDNKTMQYLRNAAEAGSPEALTMLGRIYEQGLGVTRDFIRASVYYLRAIRFDSPWSPALLWKMTRNEEYFHLLKRSVDNGDPMAKFVWSGLMKLGFDHQLTEKQACTLLEDASNQGYPEAMVELGMCYYSGQWVGQNRGEAIELLHRAQRSGSQEAEIRIWTIEIKDSEDGKQFPEILRSLEQSAMTGSVLAEAMLGYCYETGRGVRLNKSEAVRFYRLAAARGSRLAYNALRKLYDELRPNDPEYRLEE